MRWEHAEQRTQTAKCEVQCLWINKYLIITLCFSSFLSLTHTHTLSIQCFVSHSDLLFLGPLSNPLQQRLTNRTLSAQCPIHVALFSHSLSLCNGLIFSSFVLFCSILHSRITFYSRLSPSDYSSMFLCVSVNVFAHKIDTMNLALKFIFHSLLWPSRGWKSAQMNV